MNNPEQAPAETDDQKDIRLHKDVAAFSYLWIMSVFIYMAKKDSKFVRYHSKQGIVLFLLSIPVSMIPYIGKFLMFILVGGMLLGFVHAAQGKYADVPLAGELAKGDLKPKALITSVFQSMRKAIDTLENLFKKASEKKEDPPANVDSTTIPPLS